MRSMESDIAESKAHDTLTQLIYKTPMDSQSDCRLGTFFKRRGMQNNVGLYWDYAFTSFVTRVVVEKTLNTAKHGKRI